MYPVLQTVYTHTQIYLLNVLYMLTSLILTRLYSGNYYFTGKGTEAQGL